MMPTIADAALSLSHWIELSILVKATVMLAVGLIAARLAGRARASVRHLVLAATFGMLIALPFIVVAAPGVIIQVPVTHSSTGVAPAGAVPPPDGSATRASAVTRGATEAMAKVWPIVVRAPQTALRLGPRMRPPGGHVAFRGGCDVRQRTADRSFADVWCGS